MKLFYKDEFENDNDQPGNDSVYWKDCWHIAGIARCIAMFPDGTFWLIPAATQDDDKVADDGPFESFTLACVYAAFLDRT